MSSDFDNDRLSGAMQENLLTLLCFDPSRAPLIRNSVTAQMFENAVLRDVAANAMDFLDQFKEPVGEHLPDTLEHVLKGPDERKAGSYSRVLDNLYGSKETVNGDYIISQLNKFIRQQNIKSSIVTAVEAIEDGRVDDAELALTKGLKTQAVSFEIGTQMRDARAAMRFMDATDTGFITGIEELDKRDAKPRRKELFMFVAPRGRGKSWAMTHLAKMGLLQRLTVLVVTLEMSEERYAQRLLQAFFSVSKRTPNVSVPVFRKDDNGVLLDLEHEEVERQTLADPGIRSWLASRVNREFRRRPPLIVKEFPTGSLTMSGLEAYLDGLERFHKITPDLMIIDYPDLMNIDTKNLRVDTGKIYAGLRGLGVARNMAVVVPSQGNRDSESAKLVTASMVSEDISKLAIADTVITYSQTPAEKKLGLARLLCDKNRNDEDKFQVLISQAYQMGQFSLDSAAMSSEYWGMVEPRKFDDED